MITLDKKSKFIGAIILQVAVIFVVMLYKFAILSGGTEILLQIRPVDPRDLLRGDYVTFQYDTSDVYNYNYASQRIMDGDTVYVSLDRSGKYWAARRVSKERPKEGNLYIKGKVESGGASNQANVTRGRSVWNEDGEGKLHIVYGIEEYFIPEGKGRNFSFAGKDASARVVIDDSGKSTLKQIYIDDKPWP